MLMLATMVLGILYLFEFKVGIALAICVIIHGIWSIIEKITGSRLVLQIGVR